MPLNLALIYDSTPGFRLHAPVQNCQLQLWISQPFVHRAALRRKQKCPDQLWITHGLVRNSWNVPFRQSVHCSRPVEGRFSPSQLRNSPTCKFVTKVKSLYTPPAFRKALMSSDLIRGHMSVRSHERLRTTSRLLTLEGGLRSWRGRLPRWVLAQATPRRGESGMRSANGRNPSTNRRAPAELTSPPCSAEQRETLRRGLRILTQMTVRAHLRRQASQSGTVQEPPAEGEDGD